MKTYRELLEVISKDQFKKAKDKLTVLDPNDKEAQAKAEKIYLQWFKQNSNIVNLLTKSTGMWYVGSTKQKIIENSFILPP